MKKSDVSSKDFRSTIRYLGVTLQDFAYYSGFSVDYVRSISCGRKELTLILLRTLNLLIEQQNNTKTNDCKKHANGEIK